MSVLIRTYQGGDEEGIVAVWNRSMPQDPISGAVFMKRVLADVNFDPAGLFVALRDGRVAGALFAVVRSTPMWGSDLEPGSAWITFFCVDPDYRRQGIGRALFAAARDYCSARDRKTVYFSSYAPNYFLPGIDAVAYPAGKLLLEAAGFRVYYGCAAMDKGLVGYEIPDDVRQLEVLRRSEGYDFGPLTMPYLTQVIDFSTRVFNADWGRAIREALVQGVPMHRFLVAVRQGIVEGFCMYGGYDGIAERFGPFGVDPQRQGAGLGKILLYRCMEAMRAEGLHTAWFLWTGETSPAGHLYLRAGFAVTRRFEVMRLMLD